MRLRAVGVGLMTLGLGCASSTPWKAGGPQITASELLAGTPLETTPGTAARCGVTGAQVLALNPEMRAFVEEHVSPAASPPTRLRQLGRAIIHSDTFGLQYDETTRTAAETFRDRRGNCLSFSNMFVALARQADLDVYYQEVDTPPDWTLRNEAFVLNRHVNVLVDLGLEGERVVDFNLDDFRASYERRRISDRRALAHHYNNLAVERMQRGDVGDALGCFRAATEQDAGFSPAWTNLGTLYLRHGHRRHAEAAYLRALRVDGSDSVAMSNLARLYEQRGDHARAADYRQRVTHHRRQNPYYRFQRARAAFLARDYDTAIDHLTHALRKKKNEDRFYFLLGLCHLEKGNPRAARRWLARAEEVAASDVLKHRYASKVDRLLSGRTVGP